MQVGYHGPAFAHVFDPAQGFGPFERCQHIGTPERNEGAVDAGSPADVAEDGAAPLGHAVDLALLDVVAGPDQCVGHDHPGQDHTLAADTGQKQTPRLVRHALAPQVPDRESE